MVENRRLWLDEIVGVSWEKRRRRRFETVLHVRVCRVRKKKSKLCYVNELYYRIIKYQVAVDITCCYYDVRFDYVYVIS